MAETVYGHSDRFAGFVGATPLSYPDAATEEASRAVRDLGALGVQLEVDAVTFPLHEERYDPLFALMEELGGGVWLHPFRMTATSGLPVETPPFLLCRSSAEKIPLLGNLVNRGSGSLGTS